MDHPVALLDELCVRALAELDDVTPLRGIALSRAEAQAFIERELLVLNHTDDIEKVVTVIPKLIKGALFD